MAAHTGNRAAHTGNYVGDMTHTFLNHTCHCILYRLMPSTIHILKVDVHGLNESATISITFVSALRFLDQHVEVGAQIPEAFVRIPPDPIRSVLFVHIGAGIPFVQFAPALRLVPSVHVIGRWYRDVHAVSFANPEHAWPCLFLPRRMRNQRQSRPMSPMRSRLHTNDGIADMGT